MSHAAAAGAVLALLLAALPMAAARAADSPGAAGPATVAVGSKTFTENVVLGELIAQLARSAGAVATHRRDLGGTQVLWSALQRGDVDVYPDYTGTIRVELLGLPPGATGAELRAQLASRGVRMSRPLGFNNTYAIGMRRERAEALGIERISQLSAFPSLRFGLTSEFMDRKDGWPGLSRAYGLQAADARGLDHDLAYRGLAGGSLDVTDLYSTDADIRY